MKADELFDYLIEEGCNPAGFRIGDKGGTSDVFCLKSRSNGEWYVCYSERGSEQDPEFSSRNEEEAVEYFRRKILSMVHRHCVGFFSQQPNANKIRNRLQAAGLHVEMDHIPYGGPDDPRYRVFVIGKAVFPARELLGEPLPKTDS